MNKKSQISGLWVDLYQMTKQEDKVQCLKYFKKTADSGLGVFESLSTMFSYNLRLFYDHADSEPKFPEFYLELKDLVAKLNKTADDQTFAFRYVEDIDEIFDQQIILPGEFKFLKEGLHYVRPDMKSMIIYEQFIPFNNKYHDDKSCVALKDLPLFYKKKGKIW